MALAQRRVRRAAVAAQERDEAIRGAHATGNSIRAIAEATGLSASRIHQILHGK